MAANSLEGEVEIQLDRPRPLKLTFRACTLYEQQTGQTVDEFFLTVGAIALKYGLRDGDAPPAEAVVELLHAARVDRLAALLWVCLLHGDRRMTFDRALDLFDSAPGDTLQEKQTYITGKLREVWAVTRKPRAPEAEEPEGETMEGAARPPEGGSAGPST
jgi:hypothetical protein